LCDDATDIDVPEPTRFDLYEAFCRGWRHGASIEPISIGDDAHYKVREAYRHGHDLGYLDRVRREEGAAKRYGYELRTGAVVARNA